MNISKKRNKSVGKKIKNKSKNTMKNKSRLCENFCKNDYTLEMEKVSGEFYKKNLHLCTFKTPTKLNEQGDATCAFEMRNGVKTPYKPSKVTREINYKACKKRFCNQKCEGILNDKQQQLEYIKTLNNGFSKSYSKDKIEKLKNRGALSGCIYVTDYDVYHK